MVYTGDKKREYDRIWARNRRKTSPNYQKTYLRNVRLRVIEKMGGKCIYCGCDIPEALEINHLNQEGKHQDKKRYGTVNTKNLLLNILNGSRKTDDLELACRICNGWYYLVNDKHIENNWTIIWNEKT